MWKLLFAAGAVAWLFLGGKGPPPKSSFPAPPAPPPPGPRPLPAPAPDPTQWYVFDKYAEAGDPELYKVTAKSENEALRWIMKKLDRAGGGGLRSGPWHEWETYPGDRPPRKVKAGK